MSTIQDAAVLLVEPESLPRRLEEVLGERGSFVETTEAERLAGALIVSCPDVIVAAFEHRDAVLHALQTVQSSTPFVMVTPRGEISKLRFREQEGVAGIVASDMPPTAMVVRIQTIVNQASKASSQGGAAASAKTKQVQARRAVGAAAIHAWTGGDDTKSGPRSSLATSASSTNVRAKKESRPELRDASPSREVASRSKSPWASSKLSKATPSARRVSLELAASEIPASRIALMDDDVARIDAVAGELRRAGHEVFLLSQASGALRWRLLRKFAPQALVMDELAPTLDGGAWVAVFRNDPFLRNTPMISSPLASLFDQETGEARLSPLVSRLEGVNKTELALLGQLSPSREVEVGSSPINPGRLLELLAGYDQPLELHCEATGAEMTWQLSGGDAGTAETRDRDGGIEHLPPREALDWLLEHPEARIIVQQKLSGGLGHGQNVTEMLEAAYGDRLPSPEDFLTPTVPLRRSLAPQGFIGSQSLRPHGLPPQSLAPQSLAPQSLAPQSLAPHGHRSESISSPSVKAHSVRPPSMRPLPVAPLPAPALSPPSDDAPFTADDEAPVTPLLVNPSAAQFAADGDPSDPDFPTQPISLSDIPGLSANLGSSLGPDLTENAGLVSESLAPPSAPHEVASATSAASSQGDEASNDEDSCRRTTGVVQVIELFSPHGAVGSKVPWRWVGIAAAGVVVGLVATSIGGDDSAGDARAATTDLRQKDAASLVEPQQERVSDTKSVDTASAKRSAAERAANEKAASPAPRAEATDPPPEQVDEGAYYFSVQNDETVKSCNDLLSKPRRYYTSKARWEGQAVWKRSRTQLLRGESEASHVLMCQAALMDPPGPASEGLTAYYLSLRALDEAKEWAKYGIEHSLTASRKSQELLGDVMCQLGEIEDAKEIWLSTMQLERDDLLKRRAVARTLMASAGKARRGGDLPLAERLLRRAVLVDEDNADAGALLAATLFKNEQPTLAERWAKRALSRNETTGYALLTLGDLALEKGNATEARAYYEKVPEGSAASNQAGERLEKL